MKRTAAFCLLLLTLGAVGWIASGVALGGGSGFIWLDDPSKSTSTDSTTDTSPTTTDTAPTTTDTSPTTTDTTPTTTDTTPTTTDTTPTTTDTTPTTTTTVDNPPTFQNVPADVTVEANGPSGSVVHYVAPTAVDDIDTSPPPVACAPASGATFPLGGTTVTCTATDSGGHTGNASFKVTVRDTTAPILLVPAPHSVYATSALGVSDSDPAVVSFVNAASATDIVDPHPVVGTNIRSVVPVGQTVITFHARDFSGNSVSRDVLLTVLPKPPTGTPPLPPPVVASPPRNVTNLTAAQGDGAITLRWQLPANCDHVIVSRSAPDGSGEQVVYSGKASSFTEKGLQNGVQYRYVIRCADPAGNRSAGVAVLAMPMQNRLRVPKEGARLRKPPKLIWAAEPDADYYNVQLFRNGKRILAAWPKKPSLALKKRWKYLGRSYTMNVGTYQWYVWPGYGNRKNVDYGALLGFRTFSIRR